MKRLIWLLVFILTFVSFSPAIPVTGRIITPDGSYFTGTLVITLQLAAGATLYPGDQFITQGPVRWSVTNGLIPASAALLSNDAQIAPTAATYYIAYLYDSGGSLVQMANFYVSGSTFDIGAAIQTNITTPNLSFQDIIGLRNLTNTGYATLNNLTCTGTTTNCGSGSGGGNAYYTGTVNVVPHGSSTPHTLVDGSMVDAPGTPVLSPAGMDSVAGGFWYQVSSTNNSSPGTAAGLLVCYDSLGFTQTCPITTVRGVLGIAGVGAGTSGNVHLCFILCVGIADNSTTIGDWAVASATTAGWIHDTGVPSTSPAPAAQSFVIDTAATNGNPVAVDIFTPYSSSDFGSTYVAVNGTRTLPTANFGSLPAAGSGYVAVSWATQADLANNATDVNAKVAWGTNSIPGVVAGDGTTTTVSGGVMSALGAPPTGSCGGDLGGTFPNCTVTNLSHVSNSSAANSALVHTGTTVNGQNCVLGSSCTVTVSGGTMTIASGTATMGTSAIASAACSSVVTVTASGVATTDNIQADFNADPTSTTGFMPGAMLTIVKFPTSGHVNFYECNNTGSSITPAAVTLNWRVVR